MSKKKPPGPYYEVGYAKPPKRNCYKKGQSGNPRGRPPGAKNKVTREKLNIMILDEAFRTVTIRSGDQELHMPTIRAGVRNCMQQAAKGDLRALRIALKQAFIAETKLTQEEELRSIIERKS